MSTDSQTASIAAGATASTADKIDFPVPRQLRSRDVFRLVVRVWPFIRPYRRHLFYLFLLTLPGLLGGLFALNISRVFFDVVGHGDPMTPAQAWFLHLPIHAGRRLVLIHACVATSIVFVVVLVVLAAISTYAIWILQRISNLFRVNLYTRLQELSVQFHSQEKIGDAIFRMFQDSAAIPQVINGLIVQPLIFVPAAIGTIVWLFMYDHMMALIAIALMPANFILAWLFSAPLRRAFIGEREAAALATTRIEETLASIKTVKAFGTETSEAEIYARDNWQSFIAARRARMLLAGYRVTTNTIRGLGYVTALYLGALEVIAGGTAGLAHVAVSLGLFQGSISLFDRVSTHTRFLTDLWGNLQDVVVAIARVLEMLARIPEQSIGSGHKIPPKNFSRLSFRGVTFGYDPRSPVLSDVTIDATAGQLTAIAGASGSGKSTIIALAVRFFEPSAGSIALDDTAIRDFDLPAWRSILSVALQENPLFTATLRDNIAYGRPDASVADVMRAIERAGLSNFLHSLPAGLETMLGEKGAKLSSGQAQRIGLARAMLRDVPILLLDEPTSALDVSTENAVMRGVRAWIADDPQRRLAIVATHRRTTANFADRIYQIADGRLLAADQSAFDAAPTAEAGNV